MPRNSDLAADTGLPATHSERIAAVHHKSLILAGLITAADSVMEGIGPSDLGTALFACLDRALLLSREVEAELGEIRT